MAGENETVGDLRGPGEGPALTEAARREERPSGVPRALRGPAGLLLLFGAPVLLLMAPALSGGVLYARDIFHYYWPTRDFVAQSIGAGSLPLWNPTSQSGLPALADIHAATLYPPNLLHQWLSFPAAYAWLVALHLMLAMGGLYVVARQWGLRRVSAVGGAYLFALSGYFAGLVNMGPLLAAGAYVPWILAALGSKRMWLPHRVVAAGAAMALQALAGDPQSVLFSSIAALAFAAWSTPRARALLSLAGAWALAGLLAAIQLVPAWHLLTESTRASGVEGQVDQWAFHPLRFLELGLPFVFGGYLEAPYFWASGLMKGPGAQPFALSVYLGLATLVLAVWGTRKDRLSGFAWTMVAVGLLLALGPWSPGRLLLERVPPFAFFRYPEKYLFLVVLGVSLLGAAGIDRVAARTVRRWRLWAPGIVLAIVAVLAVGASVFSDATEQLLSAALTAANLRVPPELAAEAARAALWAAFGPAALVWIVAALSETPIGRVAAPLVVLIACADLAAQAGQLFWFGAPELYELRPPLVDAIAKASPLRPFRFIRDTPSLIQTPIRAEDDPYSRRIWDLATLKSNVGTRFGLEEASGYGAVSLSRWQSVSFALHRSQGRLAQIFNTCVAIGGPTSRRYSGSEGFEKVAELEPGVSVYRFANCLPRLRTVSSVQSVSSLDEALKRLRDPELDLGATAIVEGVEPRPLGPGTVTSTRFGVSEATANVEAAAPGAFLVLANSFDPGWTVEIDGAPGKVLPVNAATMGAFVPVGQHEVVFRYRPRGLLVGCLLTLLGFVASVMLLSLVRTRTPPRLAHLGATRTPNN